ncbi:hemicentin-2-like [Ixodes scapularis]
MKNCVAAQKPYGCTAPGETLFCKGPGALDAYSDIIENTLVPYVLDGPFPDGCFFLQQDRSPVHKARKVSAMLEASGIHQLEWPPNGADCNTIENIWGTDPPALTVTKLRASDSGAYTCKVSYAEGTSQTCTTDVHVAGTEELPLVYDSEGKTVQGKIGPYLEGSSLALTCEAGSDFDLSWHWNSTVLPGKRHIDMKTGVVRSQLNHRNISRSDLNADITCTASNSFGDDFKRTLKLDVWTKPTDIRIRPRPFNEDAAASVECEVLGSRPSPLVTWYLGDHGPLDASFTHDQTDDAVTTSVLTFTAQAGDSGKTLMCVAEHRIIDYKINTSFVVEVQYEPKVVLSLNASRPGAGEDVYLECEIQANPMATHVHWYLNSDPIAAFPLDVYQHTVTLRKTQVTPRDSGEYQCAALSSYGVGRSNVVNIYINEKGSGDLSTHLSVDIQLISFSALASATSYFIFP